MTTPTWVIFTFFIARLLVQQAFADDNPALATPEQTATEQTIPEPVESSSEGSAEPESSALDTPDTSDTPPKTFEWLESKQQLWSQNISTVGGYLDSFMDDNSGYQDINRSFIKLYFDVETSKYDGVSLEPKIKVSLDLPVTKKKLRLVIENDPDQELGIKERNLSELPSTEREVNDGFYGAVRYLFESKKWSRLSLDWGVKARWPPDPFARFRAVRGWDLNKNWGMVYSQEVFIFESEGFGTYTQFDFNRWLAEKWLFRFTSVVDWHERTEQFDLLEQLSLFQDINDKRAIQYAVGIVAEEKKGSRITNYYTKATYRRRLYKDWLFYQLTPGVEFQRVEDFKPNPFLSFRIEMLFSKDVNRKLTTRLY